MQVYMLILEGQEAGGMIWNPLLIRLYFFFVVGCHGKDFRLVLNFEWSLYVYVRSVFMFSCLVFLVTGLNSVG